MGYTFAFQNPGSIFGKSSATTGVAAAAEIGTRESPTFAYVYFIDNAYRAGVPSLAPDATGRRNKVPYECSARRWLPFSSFRQILSLA